MKMNLIILRVNLESNMFYKQAVGQGSYGEVSSIRYLG